MPDQPIIKISCLGLSLREHEVPPFTLRDGECLHIGSFSNISSDIDVFIDMLIGRIANPFFDVRDKVVYAAFSPGRHSSRWLTPITGQRFLSEQYGLSDIEIAEIYRRLSNENVIRTPQSPMISEAAPMQQAVALLGAIASKAIVVYHMDKHVFAPSNVKFCRDAIAEYISYKGSAIELHWTWEGFTGSPLTQVISKV